MEKKPEIDQAVKENIQEVAVTVMANENDIERH